MKRVLVASPMESIFGSHSLATCARGACGYTIITPVCKLDNNCLFGRDLFEKCPTPQ